MLIILRKKISSAEISLSYSPSLVVFFIIYLQGLAHWCTHGHSRRGLERWGSQYHGTSRTDATDSSKSTVVNLNLSGDELAREASRLSLSSRVFARMMGEADEAAAIRTHTELRRWSGGATMRVQAMHRTSSLPLRGLVRTNL
jgi:hypothetical protein